MKQRGQIEAAAARFTFSILNRIVVGEAALSPASLALESCFSILNRIVVGEARSPAQCPTAVVNVSVSSIGSWWVKLFKLGINIHRQYCFSILNRIVVGEAQALWW